VQAKDNAKHTGFHGINSFAQKTVVGWASEIFRLSARQAWRLLVFPDSLCARLLKAKYFPNGDLLDTAFPSVVLSTWKAIMFGLELLKKGVIWRVGNGKQIKIWRHAWLPKPHSLRPGKSKRPCRLKWFIN